MFDEHEGNLSIFQLHGEVLVPAIVVGVSLFFALFMYFNERADAPVAAFPEPASPDTYVAYGLYEYGAPASPDEDDGVRAPEVFAVEPEPIALEQWVLNHEPSSFFVVQETNAYACPDTACDIVGTLQPGAYWRLPFTPVADGWFKTTLIDRDESGYIAVSTLSAEMPERCRLILPYRIGHVGQRFLDEGFDREQLRTYVLAAEAQIEAAIGRNVLVYDEQADNTINFLISHFNDAEPFHRGLHRSNRVFPNGTVGSFWIGVYAALFDDVDGWVDAQYIGLQHVDTFKANYMRKTLLHEMVHVLGFGHLNDPAAVMCGAPDCSPVIVDLTNELLLTPLDKQALVEWCQ